ncbi:MAG TPA: IS3 family transposase [Thermodesulfovibrionia bacterium]|nr:IS3 family transposase [Thermodesulfovibrionia bacterium]
MKGKRKQPPDFKFKVALEALKGLKTASELSSIYEVHSTLISNWKKQLTDKGKEIFSNDNNRNEQDAQSLQSALYEEIGQLKFELDWLKKKLPPSETKRAMIELNHEQLSIRRQCDLLGLNRASLYYQPVPESKENLHLMRLIDEQYLKTPFFGSRRMTAWLAWEGYFVNRKRVQRLMRLMGIEAVYSRPHTSKANPSHKVYPYLLRDLDIVRPNQVWSTDITYIPMPRGYMYLVAIIDWYSRYVLSWKLSNTMDVGFCLDALEEALKLGKPTIFNSDQGSQFTSLEFTGRLEAEEIAISMDGRGRALDNIFVERLWRSVKYEDIYILEFSNFVGIDIAYFDVSCQHVTI